MALTTEMVIACDDTTLSHAALRSISSLSMKNKCIAMESLNT